MVNFITDYIVIPFKQKARRVSTVPSREKVDFASPLW